MSTKDLYKGTIETFIFQLLTENKRMYGYEIAKKITEMTNKNLVISESKLYPALHKLEEDGYLTSSTENIGNRIRKYYSLSENGSKEAVSKLSELENFISVLSNVIRPKLNTI